MRLVVTFFLRMKAIKLNIYEMKQLNLNRILRNVCSFLLQTYEYIEPGYTQIIS